MDAKAILFWRRANALPRHQTIQDEPWPIWILERKVTSNISTSIYTYIHNYQGDQYWLPKPDVNKALLKEVDWMAAEIALQSIPRQIRVFLTKHVCGMCGVGKFMQRWKEWQHDSCLRCGTREDASHVWLCQGQDINLLWEKALIGLHEWMMKVDTDPNIVHLIITALTAWRNGDNIPGNSIFCTIYLSSKSSSDGKGSLTAG
jgi:hypothetical protein